MNALLLAAGFGTRLRPITEKTPKCLVKIGGKTLLDLWIKKLHLLGIKKIFINTHYLSHEVEDFVSKNKYKDKIFLIYEKELLGTAGTLSNFLKNFNFIDELIFLHVDNYCEDNLKEFKKAHDNRPKGCIMTMLTFKTNEPKKCGVVLIDKNKIVKNFYEKSSNPPSNLANGALYYLSKEFINIYKKKFFYSKDFSNEVLPFFMDKIFTVETFYNFIDIGTIKNYKLANKLIVKKNKF